MQKEIDFPVRVLMVFRRLFSGGSQHFIMNQYRAIDRTKVQFDFVVHGDEAGIFESEVRELGGKIYRCPYIYNGVNHISYCKWWKRFYGSHPEYEIVYGHLMSTASIYLYYAKKTGKVTICHSHSSSNGKGFSAVIKDMMQYPIRYIADYKFACSEDAGKWLYGNNIINNRNFMVIPIGIDLKRFKYSESKRNEIRNALNLKGRYVIGHIGRFETVKNHTFLIDLFSVLLKQLPDAKLLLVGDGSMRKNIEKKCIRLGIRTNVVFAGSRTNPEEFYQAMDVVVYPSLWEGFPVVLVECQASGLPCIVSNTLTKEINVTGLVDYVGLDENVNKWVEKIMLCKNYSKARNMQPADELKRYDVDTISLKMAKLYIKIYKEKIQCEKMDIS